MTINANDRSDEGRRRRNNVVETRFEIRVPQQTNLDIDVFSSPVTIEVVSGRYDINGFSGNVRLLRTAEEGAYWVEQLFGPGIWSFGPRPGDRRMSTLVRRAKAAAKTLAARAELVQIVERSSHRMDAAQQTTPELQAAIEESTNGAGLFV